MNRKIIVGVLLVAVVAGVGIYIASAGSTTKPYTKTATEQSTQPTTTPSNDTAVATITYSDSGFSPATTTVKAGDTLAIKNNGTAQLSMHSDPHPEHTDDADLNVGDVAPGQTKTFKVTKTGSFGIHNHLKPSDSATIVIQ